MPRHLCSSAAGPRHPSTRWHRATTEHRETLPHGRLWNAQAPQPIRHASSGHTALPRQPRGRSPLSIQPPPQLVHVRTPSTPETSCEHFVDRTIPRLYRWGMETKTCCHCCEEPALPGAHGACAVCYAIAAGGVDPDEAEGLYLDAQYATPLDAFEALVITRLDAAITGEARL